MNSPLPKRNTLGDYNNLNNMSDSKEEINIPDSKEERGDDPPEKLDEKEEDKFWDEIVAMTEQSLCSSSWSESSDASDKNYAAIEIERISKVKALEEKIKLKQIGPEQMLKEMNNIFQQKGTCL